MTNFANEEQLSEADYQDLEQECNQRLRETEIEAEFEQGRQREARRQYLAAEKKYFTRLAQEREAEEYRLSLEREEQAYAAAAELQLREVPLKRAGKQARARKHEEWELRRQQVLIMLGVRKPVSPKRVKKAKALRQQTKQTPARFQVMPSPTVEAEAAAAVAAEVPPISPFSPYDDEDYHPEEDYSPSEYSDEDEPCGCGCCEP